MESLHIRLAEPRDDEALGQLLVEAFSDAFARKMPEIRVTPQRAIELRATAKKRAEGLVLVAELGGELVGTASAFPPGAPHNESWLADAADIRHLGVSPRFHGRGFAGPILDDLERRIRAWPVNWITLHVRRGSVGVVRLYEQRGYVRAPEGDLPKPTVYLEGYKRPAR